MGSSHPRGQAGARDGSAASTGSLLLLAVFLSLLPRSAAAQTGEPAARPSPEAPPGDLSVGGPTSSWRVFLGLFGGYDTNVDFEVPGGAGDEGFAARASISHTARSPRGQFSFSVQGDGVRYRHQTDANRVDGSARLDTSYKLSTRTTLSFNAGASYVNTDLSRILIEAGIQLPRTQTFDYGGGVGLELRPGERTTLSVTGRYDRVDFDTPDLLDTASATAGLSLARRLSTRSSLSLNYSFLRTNDQTEGFDSHQAALGWSRALTRRLTLSLSSGAGYALEPGANGSRADRVYYYGTAGLLGQIRRSTLNLQLRRSANPAYGLGGNVLSYGAALSAGIPFGRHARLSLGGVHTWSEDPTGLDPVEKFVTDDATATLSLTFLRRLGLSLGYLFRRYDPEEGPTVLSHRGDLGLTWTYTRP